MKIMINFGLPKNHIVRIGTWYPGSQLMWSENKSVTHNLTHVQKLNLHLYDEQLTTSKDKLLYGKNVLYEQQ